MSSTEEDSNMVVVAKRLDPDLVNRTHVYANLKKGTKVLVVVASGNIAVGEATIARLKSAGCTVTVMGLGGAVGVAPPPADGLVFVAGSVTSREACIKAVAGQDAVVHAGGAARSGSGVPSGAVSETDAGRQVVEGTKNLLEAAAAAGVKCFVFASCASVVFGGEDLKATTEDIAYPSSHIDPASAALAEAEKAVVSANGVGVGGADDATGTAGMLSCSVRAATVYGPGDKRLLPVLASRARTSTPLIGNGDNVVDFVFAGNVAHALVLATQRLLSSSSSSPAGTADGSSPAGRAFFVTDAEPVPFGDFASRALSGLGYPAPGAGMPLPLAAVLAVVLRVVAILVSPIFEFRPALTARRIAEEGKTRLLDVSRARKELGYAPLWTQEEGLDITLQASESLRNPEATIRHVGPFTLEDVAQHSTEDDAWIVVDGKVYDVTPYLGQHPGGDAMLRNAGGDSTKGFYGPQHPPQAKEILDRHYIGELATA